MVILGTGCELVDDCFSRVHNIRINLMINYRLCQTVQLIYSSHHVSHRRSAGWARQCIASNFYGLLIRRKMLHLYFLAAEVIVTMIATDYDSRRASKSVKSKQLPT